MDFLEKIKARLKEASEKVTELTGKVVEKGKQVGDEGLNLSKGVLSDLSEKTNDIANMARMKLDITSRQKALNQEHLVLGDRLLLLYRQKNFDPQDELLTQQLEKVTTLDKELQDITLRYEDLRKAYSGNFVISKLSDDLAEADAVIERVVVAEKSNVVGRQLKEIVLPREALISAIKRRDEVIIPDGNTRLDAGDQVVVIGKRPDVEKIVKRLTGGA